MGNFAATAVLVVEGVHIAASLRTCDVCFAGPFSIGFQRPPLGEFCSALGLQAEDLRSKQRESVQKHVWSSYWSYPESLTWPSEGLCLKSLT